MIYLEQDIVDIADNPFQKVMQSELNDDAKAKAVACLLAFDPAKDKLENLAMLDAFDHLKGFLQDARRIQSKMILGHRPEANPNQKWKAKYAADFQKATKIGRVEHAVQSGTTRILRVNRIKIKTNTHQN